MAAANASLGDLRTWTHHVRAVNHTRARARAKYKSNSDTHTEVWSAAAWPPLRCVIAQQYYSAIFVWLCFHSRKENFWRAFQNSLANSSPSLKLRKSKVLLIQGGFVVLKIWIAGGKGTSCFGTHLKTFANQKWVFVQFFQCLWS